MVSLIKKGLAGGFVIFALVLAVMGYFVRTANLETGRLVDGFGRDLFLTPLFARLVLTNDSLWAGYLWFAVDLVVFWSALAIAYFLFKWSVQDEL